MHTAKANETTKQEINEIRELGNEYEQMTDQEIIEILEGIKQFSYIIVNSFLNQ